MKTMRAVSLVGSVSQFESWALGVEEAHSPLPCAGPLQRGQTCRACREPAGWAL